MGEGESWHQKAGIDLADGFRVPEVFGFLVGAINVHP